MESVEAIIQHNERVRQKIETQRREETKQLPIHRLQHVTAEISYDLRDNPPRIHCCLKTCGSAKPAILFKEDIRPLFDFLRKAWPEAFGGEPPRGQNIAGVYDDSRFSLDWHDPEPSSLLELLRMAGKFVGVEVSAIEAWSKEQRQNAAWWAYCRYLANYKIACISVPEMPRHVRDLIERWTA